MIKDNIETTFNDIKWKENYMLLRKFKQEFGRFPEDKENYKGVNLGLWVVTQRRAYRGKVPSNLTQEKIDLLNLIGFQWEPFEDEWIEKFELVKEFKEEFNRFPLWEEEYKEVNLGSWCNRQRQVYKGNRSGVLTQERIDLLESIGFEWEPLEERWMYNFELVKEFKEEFNRFPKNRENYKGVNLGGWCNTQRQAYKGQIKSPLCQERIDLLESIGFEWEPLEEEWTKNFELLKEFKKEFGRFPLNKEMYEGVAIGKWCDRQRQAYKGTLPSNLTQEKIKLLESIGFKWNIYKYK